MRKLDVPTSDALAVYDLCVEAISDATLRQTYVTNRVHVAPAVADFDAASRTASWVNLPRVPNGNPGVVIAGTLTKKQLMDLYSTYMVGASGTSRKVYDDILVAAGGLCPFCGGLGHVHTLDHYLPKSNFPVYSVLPANLVPCCRDCNTGKGAAFGHHAHDQTLHPYLDDDKYFDERWVTATVSQTDPILVTFACSPPVGWTDVEKSRSRKHFESYALGYRFSVQAGAELSRLLDLRRNSLRRLSPVSFRDYLADYAQSGSFDLNGWSRTMYTALAETPWFCEADFGHPAGHLAGAAPP